MSCSDLHAFPAFLPLPFVFYTVFDLDEYVENVARVSVVTSIALLLQPLKATASLLTNLCNFA